jgi:hypothetical protein
LRPVDCKPSRQYVRSLRSMFNPSQHAMLVALVARRLQAFAAIR